MRLGSPMPPRTRRACRCGCGRGGAWRGRGRRGRGGCRAARAGGEDRGQPDGCRNESGGGPWHAGSSLDALVVHPQYDTRGCAGFRRDRRSPTASESRKGGEARPRRSSAGPSGSRHRRSRWPSSSDPARPGGAFGIRYGALPASHIGLKSGPAGSRSSFATRPSRGGVPGAGRTTSTTYAGRAVGGFDEPGSVLDRCILDGPNGMINRGT